MGPGEWVIAATSAGLFTGLGVLIKAWRGDRKSRPPKQPASASAPLPITRVEHDAHGHRITRLEDEVRRVREETSSLDRRLDEEIRERIEGERTTLREQGLTNEKLAEIVGHMKGHAEASHLPPVPRSRRRS